MRNTIIVTVLLFIAVIGASIYYFSGLNSEKKETVKPLTFLPEETFLITAFQNDPTTDNIFKDFEIFEAILGKQETKQLQLLKSKLLRSTALQPYVEATEIYVSFHPEKDKISTLITIPTVDKIKDVDLPALLTSLEKSFKVNKQDTLGHTLFSMDYGAKDSLLYVTYVKDIFFASPSKELILLVLDNNKPKLDKAHINYFVDNNSRKAPLSVYFIHDQVKNMGSHILRSKYGKTIALFDNLGGQSAWNLNFKNDALILSGESETEHKKENYIELFSYQTKTTQSLYNYFPDNTASYLSFSISNNDRFKEDLRQLFEKRNELKTVNTLQENIQKQKGIHIGTDIGAILGSEFAVVEQSNQAELLFIRLKNKSTITSRLARLASAVTDSIQRFDQSNILYSLLGDPAKAFPRPYFTQIGDVLVLANSLQTLQEYQKDWRRANLLVGTLGFKNFEKIQGNEANITYFLRMRTSSSLIQRLLKPAYQKTFTNKDNYGYQDFFSWSFQISGNNGRFLSSIYGIFKSKAALGATPEWTYEFENRPITQPWVFQHSDTSQFIVVQEQDHTIHGIHPAGKKLWSTVFSGRVVGEAQQLDDRSIILLTDKDRLYRFDTSGKPLPGFSISLPATPTATPTIAQINNEQLIFIPAGRRMLVYDIQGKEVESWKNKTIDGQIHFDIKIQEGHVYVGTDNGHFYQYDDHGKLLKEEILYSTTFKNPITVAPNSDNKSVLYTVDTDGYLYTLDFVNKPTRRKISNWDSKTRLAFESTVNRNNPLMVSLNKKELATYSVRDTSKIFGFNFTQEVTDRPQFFRNDANSVFIGVAERANSLIYLFDEKGAVVNGFPIEALPNFYYGKIDYNSGNYLLCIRRDKKLYAFKN
ncbi:PQQ-binding-like beta-propeller repeat protein [Sphingobacterium psychroaquaticum]|nr:hypothetical protein [Sphingobacterium psychroaquaticum]